MTKPSALGLISLAALLLALPGCHRIACNDHAGQSVVSPDSRYVATVVQSECLEKEHATVVELRRNRLLLKDPRVVFLIGGFRDISLAWQSKNLLAITAPTCEPKKIVLRNWKNDVTAHCEVATISGVANGK
jgi:hypothetical protein